LVSKQSTEALKEIYQRYQKQIFNAIYRYTGSKELARELIQETFTRIWFSASKYDESKGYFKGWLYTVAMNVTRTEMAKKEYTFRYSEITETGTSEYDDNIPAIERPEEIMEKEELGHSVAVALGTLRPKLREVVVMRHYQQLKFREIASVTRTAEGTLKARYHRAIDLLKDHLGPREMLCHG